MRSASGSFILIAILFFSASSVAWAGPPVAPTEPLPPSEQVKKFKLPPGFEMQLVASEPDIQKPMNLAFDARGRLWVTHSIEYPFAATDGDKARDGVTILDGFGPDGKATRVTKFADKLNIPIGVLPLGAGDEAIVWSIPNIWKLTDTDHDGVADHREVLFGPFDFVDTHGDQNSFRLGLDGWVYACHGFRNDSKVKIRGEGNVVLSMQSGNTYRFRPDGSAIEQISWGQVNPYGSCFDPRGDFFTADCHSKPITMILRGGYYDSFGKPHDGLGFAPLTTSNDHGSTGIAGIIHYDAPQVPPEYRDCFYVGNVVNNSIHRDVPQWRGSTPWVEKPHDFVTCDDWWFHPVDLQLGPDGALYIADFYNSIIGHYEVDLKHPRRDRHRGRIWRVVYKGNDGAAATALKTLDLTKLDAKQLTEQLGAPNLTVRRGATHELIRRFRTNELPIELQPSGQQQAQLVWIMRQHNSLTPAACAALAKAQPLVRVHLARALGEAATWEAWQHEFVRSLLVDADPFVRRAAAEAIGRHPDVAHVQPLLQLWLSTSPEDTQLIHATRIALRNQLRDAKEQAKVANVQLSPTEAARIAEISLAVPSEAAAWFAFDYVRAHDVSQDMLSKCMTHVAKHVGDQRFDEVAGFVRKKFEGNLPLQVAMLQSLLDGIQQRGAKVKEDGEFALLAASLAATLLDPAKRPTAAWTNHPVDKNGADSPVPWGIRQRPCADGQAINVFDSIANGEQLTGVLRSAPFIIPEKLTFWMCGHNGLPGTYPPPVNHIRLRLSDSDEIVAKEVPPRNDTAQKFTWDLSAVAGKRGVIEMVDADSGSAYAWIGVGRFEPAVVAQPSEGFTSNASQLQLALKLTEQLQITALAPVVAKMLDDHEAETSVRGAAIQAAMRIARPAGIQSCLKIVRAPSQPALLRIAAAQLLANVNTNESREALTSGLPGAPANLEQAIAISLAATSEGAEALLSAIALGKATPRLLQDKQVLDRLANVQIPKREQRIGELTANLPAADEAIRKLIVQRANGFSKARSSSKDGQAIFKKSCAACHQLANEGAKIGPQLDGIGQRGRDRLLEDILDPNRHIDGAFRATVVTTTNGLVVTGLRLREEGKVLVLADAQGKEVRLNAAEIEETRLSPLSPMPANFGEQLTEADLYHLLAFLLSQSKPTAVAK